MTPAKLKKLVRLNALAKQVKGLRGGAKSLARTTRLGLMRSETPTGAWVSGQTNWAVARIRRGLSRGGPGPAHPVVEALRTTGYAKAENLLEPAAVERVYQAFLEKIAARDRVKRVTNPDSSHPDFAGKVSITKSPNKFREALTLFERPLCQPVFEYFRSDFYIAMTEAFRIHALPEGAEAYSGSYYSEDWHLDSFQEADTLKVFVPLHPIDAADGPTEILDRGHSRRIMGERAAGRLRRNNEHVQRAVAETGAWTTMTCRPGDVYFALTNYCYHRATPPSAGRTRDILIFRLRPWHPWSLPSDRVFAGRVQQMPKRMSR